MKYDKKIAKHYMRINEKDYRTLSGENDIQKAKNLAALLIGECEHFSASGKPAINADEDAKKLLTLIKDISGEDNEVLNLYGLSLMAICKYYGVTLDESGTKNAINALSQYIIESVESRFDEILKSETDIFYALSSIDGLSLYYKITKDEKVKKLAFNILNEVDKNLSDIKLKGRVYDYLAFISGIANIVLLSGESADNRPIPALFDNFTKNFLSYNYEAANDFSDCNETDPSATAKSLEIAITLYKITGDFRYRILARRIWFNGMQFCQRDSGGVGSNTFTDKHTNLKVKEYEIKDFITPLYAIGLRCYAENKALLSEEEGGVHKDSLGRFLMGDKIFSKDESEFFGHDLIEIPTLTSFDKETACQLNMKIVF